MLKTFLLTISSIIHFFFLSKISFFYRAENNIEKTRQFVICKIMQRKEILFVLKYTNVHFWEITILCKTKYLNE